MVRTTKIAVALLILSLALGAAWGCNTESAVKIGAVLPLTGQYDLYGEPIRKAVLLAHENIQQQYEDGDFPFPLELEIVDSGGDPDRAAQQLEELFDNGAIAALGGVTSAEALRMVEIADKEQHVLVSPSASSPSLTGKSRYFVRVYPSDFREGTKIGNFAAQKLDLHNVVVIAANNPFARGIIHVFETEFDRYDGEVLEEIIYPDGTEDFSDFVKQMMTHKPEAVYVADFAQPVLKVLQELKRAGFKGRVMTTSAFAAEEVIAQACEAAEGVILSQVVPFTDSEDPRVEAFITAYQDRYDEMPGLFASHGYDAFMVLAQALRSGSRLPKDVWKGIRGFDNFSGVTGPIQFDEKGDVGKFPRVYVVEGCELSDYDQVFEKKRRELLDRLDKIRRERARAMRNSG